MHVYIYLFVCLIHTYVFILFLYFILAKLSKVRSVKCIIEKESCMTKAVVFVLFGAKKRTFAPIA